MLAAVAAMDAGGCMVSRAGKAVEAARSRRKIGHFTGHCRQCFGAGAFGGSHTGPNPTDRGKKGCKRHLLTDSRGYPLVIQTGPANERDEKRVATLLDAFPRIPQRGRPRTKPDILQGDAGYGFPHIVAALRARGIRPLLKLRNSEQSVSGLGTKRWVIERTLSWFSNFRRIKLCYERTGEHFQAFHELATALVYAKRLKLI
jgi:transposase